LDKGNKHPFAGQEVIFATKHEKEKILSPLLRAIELSIVSAEIDSDLLGTFSGEVERKGSIRETLRGKIDLARKTFPNERLLLASEGSFGPHPFLGFVQSDLESLLLYDSHSDAEIYVDSISTKVVHDERELGPRDDFRSYLKQIKFPSHAVIVRPSDSFTPVFKGLHNEHKVAQAMIDCFSASKTGRVILATDLRAHHNPTRQKIIYEAGKKLLEALRSFCPECRYPGFAITKGIPGLPCQECGEPSRLSKEVLLQCPSCKFEKLNPRPDGVKSVGPSQCGHCNP